MIFTLKALYLNFFVKIYIIYWAFNKKKKYIPIFEVNNNVFSKFTSSSHFLVI